MSKIIPTSVATTRRANTDTLVEYMGQNCTLYKIATETTDKLRDKATVTYDAGVETQVLIHWSPEIRLLKSLGLYSEEKAPLPVLSYFRHSDDPMPGDLFTLAYAYAVGSTKTNRFEIIDRKILGQDTEVIAVWVIAPARSWPLG